jgi:glycerate 2-kinase
VKVVDPDRRRQLLLELLRDALEAVDGRLCVRDALNARRGAKQPTWVFAVGKAACSMALGAHDALGPSLERVLLITKDGHVSPEISKLPNVEVIESAHPVPDERSLEAGARLLQAVDALPATADAVFLISGGASSLVEVLREGVGFDDLRKLNNAGLASGIDIEALNARRREISLIKGGRLAACLRGRKARFASPRGYCALWRRGGAARRAFYA